MFLSHLSKDHLERVDDPLHYQQQQIATLTHRGKIKEAFKMLQRVVLSYKHDARYQNSPRYLRLWIMYILCLDDTDFVFPILFGLMVNKIGDKLALLYEAIAYQQCHQKRFKDTEATLWMGIRNKAHPIKRLQQTLRHFKLTHSIQLNMQQFQLKSLLLEEKEKDSHPLYQIAKTPTTDHSLLYQLDWIDAKLHHFVRTDTTRQCIYRDINYEELRAMHHYRNPSSLHNTSDHHSIHIIPTVQNVVQLPHNPGFIQHQLDASGVLNLDTYHRINIYAKSTVSSLKSWFSTTTSKGKKQSENPLIQLGKDQYHVIKKLGQGGMAEVYMVQHTTSLTFYGLKIQQPPHLWEYYISMQISQRERTTSHVHRFYHCNDVGFLLMTLADRGTLLDALNMYRPTQSYMPEPIVLLLTYQLLKRVVQLHRVYIAHNDIKLDNVMLISSRQQPTLMMVDFGHSVDVSALPPNSLCKATYPPACPESDYPLFNQPHSPYHADYWQLATVVHTLLFGSRMSYHQKGEGNQYAISQHIKRYWHKSIWTHFFQTMLNPDNNLDSLLYQFEVACEGVSATEISLFTKKLNTTMGGGLYPIKD